MRMGHADVVRLQQLSQMARLFTICAHHEPVLPQISNLDGLPISKAAITADNKVETFGEQRSSIETLPLLRNGRLESQLGLTSPENSATSPDRAA